MTELTIKPKPEQKSSAVLLKDLKPREPKYCKRCKTSLEEQKRGSTSPFCEKCTRLIHTLRNQSSLKTYFKKGCFLVYFEVQNFWIWQPKALAEQNAKNGKDIFRGQIEEWLPQDLRGYLKFGD